MYSPRAFVEHDLSQLDALFAADPFVSLVTYSAGMPQATSLPVLYRRDGQAVLIEGHWARPNPQAGHAGDALLLVHGPHAYVSPSWYPDKATQARVPTWNYAAAQLQGRLDVFDDEAGLLDLLGRMSAHFEAAVGGNWRLDADDPRERVQVRCVFGFRFVPERIAVKHKLNQNHPLANRAAVALRLAQSPHERERAIRAMMQATLHDSSRED